MKTVAAYIASTLLGTGMWIVLGMLAAAMLAGGCATGRVQSVAVADARDEPAPGIMYRMGAAAADTVRENPTSSFLGVLILSGYMEGDFHIGK